MTDILVRRLSEAATVPARAHRGDAGLDLFAAEGVTLKPGERATVATGIAVAIPDGYAGFVQPRSGAAAKHGLGLVNSPGLIDSGYRGEVRVILINLDRNEPIEIHTGDKIAQLVVMPVPELAVRVVDDLPSSARGERGFGSSGR
ncbi:MAG: dUTP diphosphatase [Actinomycetota bacterium]|nr:dUTP diphosphatase [Actinomycetota bacterium]